MSWGGNNQGQGWGNNQGQGWGGQGGQGGQGGWGQGNQGQGQGWGNQQGQQGQQGQWGGQGAWNQGNQQQGQGWGNQGGQQGIGSQGQQGFNAGTKGWGAPLVTPWSQQQQQPQIPPQKPGIIGQLEQIGSNITSNLGFGGLGQNQTQSENFVPVPNQRYKIVSAINPSLGLDCSANPMNKNCLILWQFNGAPNQLWSFVPDNQGNYSIINAQNGGTLEIPDYSNAQQGVNLHVNQPNNTINEKWRIMPAQGGSKGKGFVLVSAHNQMVADISGGNVNNNTNIILWPSNSQLNQTWCIAPV